MKFFLPLLFLFSISTFSQSTTADDVSVIITIAETHRAENDLLSDIEREQMYIASIATLIGQQSAKITVRQQRLYDRMYKVYSVLENLTMIIQILNKVDQISSLSQELYDLAKDDPKSMLIAGFSEMETLEKTVEITYDFLRATIKSKLNLLNNEKRIKLLGKCLDSLDELALNLRYMHHVIKSKEHLKMVDKFLNGDIDIVVNFEDLDNRIKKLYEESIPDKLVTE